MTRKRIDVAKLKRGPLRHEQLPLSLVARINYLRSTLHEVCSGRIWGLVQRALRDAGFKAAPAHVAILDKGQRSVKGLNSGSEGVVTVDLILTVQKPEPGDSVTGEEMLANENTQSLIEEAIAELSADHAGNASYVYARVLAKAIQKHVMLDDLHLSDVLIALRDAGYVVDRKTGKLQKAKLSRREVA